MSLHVDPGQWRSQKLCVGCRPERRVGWGLGVPSPADYGVWGSIASGVRCKAPDTNAFSAYTRLPNASDRKKNFIFSYVQQHELLIQQ